MLDLSYLTEQEQEMIKAVLKRDAALKRVEEERVKKLQKSLHDRSKLKYLTGEWFYETKSRRHRDRIHGSDIIRASLNQKKSITLLELTQIWEERPSFVNSRNKEVFVPPELSGLLEEPVAQPQEPRDRVRTTPVSTTLVQPQQRKPEATVAEKRRNPFSGAQVGAKAVMETDGRLSNGTMGMVQQPEGEPLPTSDGNIVSHNVVHAEGPATLPRAFSESVPEPRKRTVLHTVLDSPTSDRSDMETSSVSTSPRGILKSSSRSSSSDITNPWYDGSSPPNSLSAETLETPSSVQGAGEMFTGGAELGSSPDSKQMSSLRVTGNCSEDEVELHRVHELGEDFSLHIGSPTFSSVEQKSSSVDTRSLLTEGSNAVTHSTVVPEDLMKAEDLGLTAGRMLASLPPYLSVWTATVPPSGGPVCHTSQWQNSKLTENWKNEGVVMAADSKTGTGDQEIALQKLPVDKHEHHVESYAPQASDLRTSLNEKGKGDHARVGSHGDSTRLAFQSFKLTEEENECIAKVLEWFSWSSNSSSSHSDEENQQSYRQGLKESQQHLSITSDSKTHVTPADAIDLTTPSPIKCTSGLLDEKVKDEWFYEAEIFHNEDASVTPNCDSPHLHAEVVRQPKGCVFAAEEMQKSLEQTEGKRVTDEAVNDEDGTNAAIASIPQDVKSTEVQEVESQHKLATLMSFSDLGNRGPEMLTNKTLTDSNTAERENTLASLSGSGQKEVATDQQVLCTSGEISPPSDTIEHVSGKHVSADGRGSFKTTDALPPQAASRRLSGERKENFEQVYSEMEHPKSPKEERHIHPEGFATGSALNPMLTNINSRSVHSSCLSEGQNEAKCGYAQKFIIFREHASISMQDVIPDTQQSHQNEGPQALSLTRGSPSIEEPVEQLTPYPQHNLKGKIDHLMSFWEKNKSDPRIIVAQSKEPSKSTSINQYIQPSHTVMNKAFATTSYDIETAGGTLHSDSASSLQSMVNPSFTVQPTEEQLSMSSGLKNLCNERNVSPSNEVCKTNSPASEDRPQSLKNPHEIDQDSLDSFLQFSDLPVETKLSSSPNSETLSSKSEVVIDASASSQDTCTYTGKYSTEKQSTLSVPEERGHSCDKEFAWFGDTKLYVEMKANLAQHGTNTSEQHGLPQNMKQTTAGEHIASKSPISSRYKKYHPQREKRTGAENLDREKQFTSYNVHDSTEEKPLDSPKGFRRYKASQGGEQTAYSKTCERKSSRFSEEGRSQHTLARSFIPSDYHHYLGISNRMSAADKKNTVKAISSHSIGPEVSPSPEPSRISTPKPIRGGRRRSKSTGCTSRDPQRGAENVDSSRSRAPRTRSHSSASSPCDGEDSDPLRTTLKQVTSRPVSMSKSLEDIKSLLTLSTAPATLPSSFSDPEQMKRMSMSVPAFVQEENGGRDNDLEYSGRSEGQRRKDSSFTNLSASSDVASVSSVSGSVMSIYSGDFGSVDVKGTIQFAISYVQKLSEMHIIVVQCRNLAIADIKKNRSDPYVKCYLLPDKEKLGKKKTSVKKKTVNPTYNEILRYRADIETLRTQILNLSVWHNDTFGRNSFMGEVDVDLSLWNFSNTQPKDYTLKPKAVSGMQPVEHRGEMRLALRFLPRVSQSKQSSKMGELQIWVKECKNLPMVRGAAIDPFVKCAVLPDNSKKGRQKTQVFKRTANPQFNHTMVFDGFGPEDLRETCVELTVWDHDRLSNHFLGGLRLGLGTGKSYGASVDWMDSIADEVTLWERMLGCHHEWVEDALPLRMLMMARSMSK